MSKRILWASLGLVCGALLRSTSLLPGAVLAQSSGSCDAALAAAITQADIVCAGIQDGMACAAGDVTLVGTEGQSITSALESLEALQRIGSAGFGAAGDSVGVGVLRVPGLREGQFLSAVLFGEATLSPAEAPPVGPVCTATSIGTVNVRSAPSTDAEILGQMTVNQSAAIFARLADSTWWQITWDGQPAWIFAELAPTACDLATMLVSDPATGELSGGLPAPAYQSATLISGLGTPVCANAPRGGLLLQSDEGSASWRLNEIRITLDGTALIQSGMNDALVISVLEGEVGLDYGRVVRTASAGQMLRAPLLDGLPDGLPGPALEMISPDAAGAPLALLPRPVALPTTSPIEPIASAEGTLACRLLPQQIGGSSVAGVSRLAIEVDAAQRVRVSAVAEGLQRLTVLGPDGLELARSETNDAQAPGILVADVALPVDGEYAVVAEGANQEVTFGVTCGLPEVAALPSVLTCNDFLLRWERVSGNEVQFSAPAGATISATVTHDLPSEGPASRFELQDGAGNSLGGADFLRVGSSQAAGPLEAMLYAEGTYTLRWDGDPFNLTNVEAICVPPQAAPTETPAP